MNYKIRNVVVVGRLKNCWWRATAVLFIELLSQDMILKCFYLCRGSNIVLTSKLEPVNEFH